MGLFDFFTQPKWKSSRKGVRLAAIEEMDSRRDLDVLLELVAADPEEEVALAALTRIEGRNPLEILADKPLPQKVMAEVVKKLEQIYADAIFSSAENSAELLAKIKDERLLANIAIRAEDVKIKLLAVEKIEDVDLLMDVLLQPCGKKVAYAAVQKIHDPDLLEIVGKKGSSKVARREALAKLNPAPVEEEGEAKEAADISDEAQISPELQEKLELGRDICRQIDALSALPGDDDEDNFIALCQKWPDFSEVEPCEEVAEVCNEYQKSCLAYKETCREYKEEQERFAEFQKQYEEAVAHLNQDNLELADNILADLLPRVEAISWRWVSSNDLYQQIIDCRRHLEERRSELMAIAQRQQEQLDEAKDICCRLAALQEGQLSVAKEKEFRKLCAAWDKVSGCVAENKPELLAEFNQAKSCFEDRLKDFYKEYEWQVWSNKLKKEELCAKVSDLQKEEDMRLVSRRLKEYQAAWKEIGPVARKDSDGLWQRFKSVCDEVYDRCKEFYLEQDKQREKAAELKEDLCCQAEEHVDSEDWQQSGEFLKELQKKWKEIPFAEREREQELYSRFRSACDRFFERRSAFYEEQDKIRRKNLAAKEGLCLEVEELVKEPMLEHSQKIQEIQQRWKEIGPVPRADSDAIWHRFRQACDSFYSWLDEERQHNLVKKIALCEQVEELLPSDLTEDIPREVIDQVIDLQKKWKEIGPVPKEKSDEIWHRFQGKCDLFFAGRKKMQEEEEKKRRKNLAAKEELLRQAGEAMELSCEQEITEQLKKLQARWNEIGPAPKEDEQVLWDEFHGLCNAFFEQKREKYLEKTSALTDNLKKKEELCFQLERLLGRETEVQIDKENGLDLMEQFRIAREANFILSGKIGNSGGKRAEVRRIQQEWKKVGPTFREKEQELWKRYRRAIDALYEKNEKNEDNRENKKKSVGNQAELAAVPESESREKQAGSHSDEV